MTEIATAVERIRRIAERRGGMTLLAREAGVPYTTVHSFSQRDFTNKNLEVVEKLAAAAERIEAADDGHGAAA